MCAWLSLMFSLLYTMDTTNLLVNENQNPDLSIEQYVLTLLKYQNGISGELADIYQHKTDPDDKLTHHWLETAINVGKMHVIADLKLLANDEGLSQISNKIALFQEVLADLIKSKQIQVTLPKMK